MSFLEMILKQSPWLTNFELINQDVQLTRLKKFHLIHHEKSFLQHDFKDGVYIVTGPKQIGKSTHLKMFIQERMTAKTATDYLYFNCDILDTKQDIVNLVEDYLKQFPSKNRRYILLDEITSVRDSFLAIKFLIDSGHKDNLTYILTGSNTISIKKTEEYLPGRRGRGIDFYFHPLDFKSYLQLLHPDHPIKLKPHSPEKEFITLNHEINLTRRLDDYLITGGFPRVMNEHLQNRSISDDIFTIYRAWITSEIAKADKKEHIAKRILERCLISLGSDISYNSFAQDSGVGSHNTIYEYLDFLSNAYVITLIHHYDLHQKRINYRKNKKIYFNDPFIYAVLDAWLTGKPQQDYSYLQNPILKSRLIENVVLLKMAHHFGDVHFNKEDHEIDFISGPYLAEVKYQNKISSEDYKHLEKHNYKKLLITKNQFAKTNDVLHLPIHYFLLCDL